MTKEERNIPLRGEYDLIVCGGGVAGASAAVSAKRCGVKRVLLIEKLINLGGLAVNGLISWYEPICDGYGRLCSTGIAQELFARALRCGPDRLPAEWRDGKTGPDGRRCASFFSPALFSMQLDLWLEEEGVELLLDTLTVCPYMERRRCRGIAVENKTGRGWYRTAFVIDCTGDLDMMYRAGVPTAEGENYLTYIAYVCDRASCRKAGTSANMLDARRWTAAGADLWGNGNPEGRPVTAGVTAEEVTAFARAGRRLFLKEYAPEDKNASDIACLPAMAQLRKTRRLAGAYTLTEQDMGRHFSDSVGRIGDFSRRGHVYEIPYRTLYHPEFGNMLTAGRTISASGWAWDVTRVIPACCLTGQAAGTAAALCLQNGLDAAALLPAQLRKKLEADGVHTEIDPPAG